MYKIIGVYQGREEVLDCFDDKKDAAAMLAEYRLAYGKGWYIYVR